jgi:hypothetical protein
MDWPDIVQSAWQQLMAAACDLGFNISGYVKAEKLFSSLI